jgi:hypothetical protein
VPNYTPVRIAQGPPQGLPLAGTLTGTELFPLDQATGATPPWVTCKVSLSTIASYLAGGGGFITSIVGTANEIAVSTVAGVATLSFSPNIIVPAPASGNTIQAIPHNANGVAAFVGGNSISGASNAAFFDSDTLNAALAMNAVGANYGTIGNTGTQTWGLGSSNTLGPVSNGAGSLALQWNNGGFNTNTVAIGAGTFTSTGSTYQASTRATLMINSTSNSGGSLIDFAVNGSTNAYIQGDNTQMYLATFPSNLPISFYPGNVLTGQAVGASGTQAAGFITVGHATYQRATNTSGFLDGNYPNNIETVNSAGCIYSIGGTTYVPGATSLGTMYGIGYTYSGGTALGTNPSYLPANTWGMYVTQDGQTPGVFLSAVPGAGGGVFVQTGSSFYINDVAQFATGTFTATFACGGANPTGTAHYSVAGSSVTITWPAVLGAGGGTALSISGIPAAIQPARAQFVPLGSSVVENGGVIPAGGGCFDMLFNASSGTVNIYLAGSAAAFAGATNRGFANAVSTTYQLS